MSTLFLTVEEGSIKVMDLSETEVVYGVASTAVGLAAILAEHASGTMMKSSSVDFCEEYGMEAGAAIEMIREARVLIESYSTYG